MRVVVDVKLDDVLISSVTGKGAGCERPARSQISLVLGTWLFLANEVYSACLYFDFFLISLLGDQRACLWLIVLLMVLTSSHCALVSRGGL